MHANYLDTLDWGILIAYFLILIGIGIWASLKRKKGSSLFLAERSLKWHHIGSPPASFRAIMPGMRLFSSACWLLSLPPVIWERVSPPCRSSWGGVSDSPPATFLPGTPL